jgi:hypothetical protein
MISVISLPNKAGPLAWYQKQSQSNLSKCLGQAQSHTVISTANVPHPI